MDVFLDLAEETRRQYEDGDLPKWLADPLLAVAAAPERYAGKEYLVELLVAQVRAERCIHAEQERVDDLRVWVNRERSDIPAVTHVDYSARVQTVDRRVNPLYHDIIREFEALTGCATIINTSFNVRGEPIVCTPQDAYDTFVKTGIDVLIMGKYLVKEIRLGGTKLKLVLD